ncbi:MAG: HAMP domain-containing sensor histidine kinase [Candidatus Latescibacterota bacterium]
MIGFPPSIRQKITWGFYLLLFFSIGTAVLTWSILWQVETRVARLEVIDTFLNNTLELRRFEKNYFLYAKAEDFAENRHYGLELTRLLFQHPRELVALLEQPAFERLSKLVADYRQAMESLRAADTSGREAGLARAVVRQNLEERARSQGKALTELAEEAAASEKRRIQKLLRGIGMVLMASTLPILGLGLALAASLGRKVVAPLQILEEHTHRISRGEFIDAPIVTHDLEINSLLQAFNRMSSELRARQSQLVQSEKLASLGTLVSGVAHELNNPLSNISTSAQILAEDLEDGDREFHRTLLAQIEEQSDRARDIVRTLLEFSRVRAFTKGRFPLRQLVEGAIMLIRGEVPTHVSIETDIAADLEIAADKQRLQQVFLNLIKNAIDVLSEDGHIWISAQPVHHEGRPSEVEIMVTDNGPGIPPALLSRIFDPFFTTKDVGHGSGLGLFIVHDIIELHGGSIAVDSREGEGTTFIIWLPNEIGEAP